jgi:outer membrane protein TolC
MNEPSPRATSPAGRALPIALGAIAAPAFLAACSNPLAPRDSDYGDPIPRARILEVEPLALPERAAPASEVAALPEPYDQAERLELPLERARAFTLENNLDLRVALIEPALASQALREEEAAWDAVAGIDFSWIETDQPTATQLAGSQIEIQRLTPRVDVPLRTGGSVRLGLPIEQTRTNNPFTTLNPSVTSDFEFSITQPLLRNAGRDAEMFALRLASYDEGIALAQTKLEVIRQLASADRTYWRLYAALRALDVARQQYELALEQLRRAERQLNAGRVAEIEVIRAEEGVAERLEAIIQATNSVKQEQRALKLVMNAPQLPLDEFPILWPATEPEVAPLDLNPDQLTDLALNQRMELLELELRLSADAATVAFQENQALPLFTLDYTYRVNGLGQNLSESSSLLQDNDFQDWVLALTLEQPIGNNAAEARIAQAVIQRLQRLSTRAARRLAIEQEVRDAVDNLQAGWQRILAARQSAILAGRTLEAEQRQFDVGRSTSTDVLDAATRLADAQLAEIRALTEYQIAKVDLAFATGSILGASRVDWNPLDPRQGEGQRESEDHAAAEDMQMGAAEPG